MNILLKLWLAKKSLKTVSYYYTLFYLEITTIEIRCDQTDDKYFFDEDATILASFGNPSAVLSIEWVKETDSGDHTIDTTLQKYTGSTCSNEVECPMLIIKRCNESDIGTYFLIVSCKRDLYIYSNKINLKVIKGKILFFVTYEYCCNNFRFEMLCLKMSHIELFLKMH